MLLIVKFLKNDSTTVLSPLFSFEGKSFDVRMNASWRLTTVLSTTTKKKAASLANSAPESTIIVTTC
ncbi:ORF1031 [White spot syndrome virus]|uniref:ORF1031 n=1 Tax=White spot syndrome virus TaxID=342409 RepID=A0A2D3I6P7_9VIRU|nr:ORF1031 [White spot syndrome virus]